MIWTLMQFDAVSNGKRVSYLFIYQKCSSFAREIFRIFHKKAKNEITKLTFIFLQCIMKQSDV